MRTETLYRSLAGLGVLAALTGGVGAYYVFREANKSQEEVAYTRKKMEEVKQERAAVESKLEQCLASHHPTECDLLSFSYQKLNRDYDELHLKAEELAEKQPGYLVASGGMFLFTCLGLSVVAMAVGLRRKEYFTSERYSTLNKEFEASLKRLEEEEAEIQKKMRDRKYERYRKLINR